VELPLEAIGGAQRQPVCVLVGAQLGDDDAAIGQHRLIIACATLVA
jgi:hypothetical protein